MAQKRKQKRKKSKKCPYWLMMLLLFVGAAAVCYFVWDAYFRIKDNPVDNGDNAGKNGLVNEKELEEDGSEKGKDGEKDGTVIPDVVEKERTIQYEGDDPNASESLTGAITYAGVSGDELMIRTNIDQYLTVGECELILENGGTVIYSDNVEIMSSVATSACDGFSVPVAELGAGEISITIKISANERKGTLRGKVNI